MNIIDTSTKIPNNTKSSICDYTFIFVLLSCPKDFLSRRAYLLYLHSKRLRIPVIQFANAEYARQPSVFLDSAFHARISTEMPEYIYIISREDSRYGNSKITGGY